MEAGKAKTLRRGGKLEVAGNIGRMKGGESWDEVERRRGTRQDAQIQRAKWMQERRKERKVQGGSKRRCQEGTVEKETVCAVFNSTKESHILRKWLRPKMRKKGATVPSECVLCV